MKWWKAVLLGVIAYLILSLIFTLVGIAVTMVLSIIPVIGTVIGILIGFVLTFLDGVFAGFLGGTLSDDKKTRIGALCSMLGSVIELLVKVVILLGLTGIAGVGAYVLGNDSKFPTLAAILGGGTLGTIYLVIAGIISIVIAGIGGALGGRVSVETSKPKTLHKVN